MSNTLTVAIGNYDRTRPLKEGAVTVEGHVLDFPDMSYGEMSAASFGKGTLDVAEVSLGGLLQYLDAGEPAYLGLPSFLSMGFRYDAILVASGSPLHALEDLKGKRIGLPDFAGTTAIWLRGQLHDLHGVDFRDNVWVMGALEGGAAPKRREHAEGLKVDYLGEGETLVDLLLRGEIDALIAHRMPEAMRAGRMRRLLGDVEAVESEDYLKSGNVIPLLHLPVVSKAALAADGGLAAKLQGAFEQAKDMALRQIEEIVVFNVSLPTLGRAVDQAKALIGEDYWPYGIERHRRSLELFARYCQEQGITRTQIPVDRMFAI